MSSQTRDSTQHVPHFGRHLGFLAQHRTAPSYRHREPGKTQER
jgi:hypothetical protein